MPTGEQFYLRCADAVLMVHFAFTIFIVAGLLVVWAGWFWHWGFVRNYWFRLAHLLSMGVVVFEVALGITCPLTVWENQLRTLGGSSQIYEGECMPYWVQRLLFCEWSQATFTVLYCLFFMLMLASLWFVPVRWPAHRSPSR